MSYKFSLTYFLIPTKITELLSYSQHIPFKVFNASAGAGKTFTLVKEYLKLCLKSSHQHDFYKNILAITFTNKAASEMKERILSGLQDFSHIKSTGKSSLGMFTMLCDELEINAEELQRRAGNVLEAILHDYSNFSISTIDKFTHKIIRTFAHDLKLPVNFELETDSDKLLEEAVDLLISRAGTDKKLTDLLVRFTESKTNEDKSWHIEFDLLKTARLLLDEKSHLALKELQQTDIDDFIQLKKYIKTFNDNFGSEISTLATAILKEIEDQSIDKKSFIRTTFPNYLERLKNASQIKKYSDFIATPTLQKNITENKWYAAKTEEQQKHAIDSIAQSLQESYKKIEDFLENELSRLILFKEIDKNLYALAVLNEIEKQLEELKSRNNILHISEFNKKIASIIEQEPVPFIYERIGEKYTHYFIDEFQDTSRLQWKNLLPLVENAIASIQGACLIVGDGKQAIYRWRGGEVEQFLEISSTDAADNKVLVNDDSIQNKYLKDIQNLPTNWRSFDEIIHFNNRFFNCIAQSLPNDTYKNLYQLAKQNTSGKKGGYVEMNFVPYDSKQDYIDVNLEKCYQYICDLLEEGFLLKDICVITRNNRNGSALASFLIQKDIPVVSSESLLIAAAPSVRFLIAVITYLVNNNDKSARTQILEFLISEGKIEVEEEKHLFYKNAIHGSSKDFREILEDKGIPFQQEYLHQLSLYEAFEALIVIFHLFDKPDSYLQFFLDLVLNFSHKKNNTFTEFLDWWYEQQNKHSIVIPEGTNAVRLMTIHKSKGLEFPIVIFPFANWQSERENEASEWIQTDDLALSKFKTMLLPMTKNLELAKDTYYQQYQSHSAKVVLDNVNLLYVVLTRAVQRLYITTSTGKFSGNLSKYFVQFLEAEELWNKEETHYTFGEKTAPKKDTTHIDNHYEVDHFTSENWREKISISLMAPSKWETDHPDIYREKGTIIHEALALCKYADDIDNAVAQLLFDGMIDQKEEKSLKNILQKVIFHPEIQPLFDTKNRVKNEMEILAPNGQLFRPDRVVIHQENEITIVDYKTGKAHASHRSQVDNYAAALEQLGFSKINKLLIYIPSLAIDKNWNTQYNLF